MAFSELSANQMVSYAEAASGGFVLKSGQTNPGTTQMMTKDMAFTIYNLAVNANTNGIAGNQLMQKSFWNGTNLDCTLIITAASSPYYTAILGSDAGGGGGGHLTFATRYLTGGTYPVVGTIVYTDTGLTTRYNGQNSYWDDLSSVNYYFDNGRRYGYTSYQINSTGVITAVIQNNY
tara:strand:+ start:1960 stop:2490 length:531 start_codon:yes stop_codon:yes gene_type:complete